MDREEIRKAIIAAGTEGSCFGASRGEYLISQHVDELAELVAFLVGSTDEYAVYMETGAAACGTARILNDFLSFETIYLVDNDSHPHDEMRFSGDVACRNRLAMLDGAEVITYVGSSHDKEWGDTLRRAGAVLNLVMIDGDHSPDGCWEDVELAREFMVPGSVLVLHDVAVGRHPRVVAQALASTGAGFQVAGWIQANETSPGTAWFIKT